MGKIKIKTKHGYVFLLTHSHLNTDILKESYSLKNLPESLRWQGGKRFIEKYRGYAIYLKDNEYIAVPRPKLGSICGKTVEEVKECIDYIEEEKALKDWMKEK